MYSRNKSFAVAGAVWYGVFGQGLGFFLFIHMCACVYICLYVQCASISIRSFCIVTRLVGWRYMAIMHQPLAKWYEILHVCVFCRISFGFWIAFPSYSAYWAYIGYTNSRLAHTKCYRFRSEILMHIINSTFFCSRSMAVYVCLSMGECVHLCRMHTYTRYLVYRPLLATAFIFYQIRNLQFAMWFSLRILCDT